MLHAADAATPAQPILNRFPRLVHDQFVDEVRRIMQARAERISKLATKADALAYIADVRAKIARSFGPWPERTPLNPKVTGVVERDAYRIENVIFESRPQFFVTANLYIPKGLTKKAPAVVGSCGHSTNGKAHDAYQSFAQGLARQGYVSLIFDPIGQGERLQLPDENLKPRIGVGVGEHMMVGNAQFLVGQFFGAWRAWDGMRALDYLLSREEVDPTRVGITGNSGGGTMTTWLCGVEPRFTMAAPSCFVTSFLNNLENELPADTEQCPPFVLAHGLDHGDFIACMAPKPVVLLTQEKDYFDVRGALGTLDQLRHIYKLLGAEQNISLFTGPGGHGYAQDAREAMYAVFNRATGVGESNPAEPKLIIESDKTLQCTKNGQVTELKSRPVYSFTKEIADDLAEKRREVNGEKLTDFVTGLKTERSADIDGRPAPIRYRILRPRRDERHPLPFTTTYLLERPADRMSVVPLYRLYDALHYSRPPEQPNPAFLYVSHDSADAELRDEPLVRELFDANPGAAWYVCDVRGIGDSRPNTCGDNSYNTAYGCDYFYASYGIMLGRDYVRRRIGDVFLALAFIAEARHQTIHLVAKGYGAISACIAALADDNVKQVTLKNALTSYTELAGTDIYKWPLSSFIPNILAYCDLPEIYRELKAKKGLRIIDPLGPTEKPV
jgi:dienelactone hydrolase